MKKAIYVFIGFLLLSLNTLNAQQAIADPDKMWTVPSVYTMDEPVTWYFDLSSASTLADGENLYLWIWAPTNPTGNPIPIKYEGDKVWSISFTPTQFFNMTVEQLFANTENFYFLLRDLDGNKLTSTLSFPKVNYIKEFTESGKVIDFAPSNFQLGSTLTILFNSNLVDGFNPAPSTVHMHGGLNDWDAQQQFQAWLPEIREKTKFRHVGNGIYKKDLVPQTYFGVTEEYEMENLVFLVVKYNGNDATPDWAGASPDYKILAPNAPIPPAPVFYYFPQKFSQLDMLTLVRKNNERATSLEYTITAGTKTITGAFSGTMTELRANINLLSELNSAGPISKIGLVVKRNGIEILKTDIPLVPTSELE